MHRRRGRAPPCCQHSTPPGPAQRRPGRPLAAALPRPPGRPRAHFFLSMSGMLVLSARSTMTCGSKQAGRQAGIESSGRSGRKQQPSIVPAAAARGSSSSRVSHAQWQPCPAAHRDAVRVLVPDACRLRRPLLCKQGNRAGAGWAVSVDLRQVEAPAPPPGSAAAACSRGAAPSRESRPSCGCLGRRWLQPPRPGSAGRAGSQQLEPLGTAPGVCGRRGTQLQRCARVSSAPEGRRTALGSGARQP